VWDTRTWNQIAVLHGHSGIVEDARFSPDGSRAVTVGDDGTARVWDTITGDVLAVLAVPGGTVLSAEFARDGNRIVTATDDGTRVWEASGFRPIRRITLPHDAPRSYHVYFEDARFSPNSRVVATVSTWPPIYLWQATSGKRLARLPGRGPRLRTSLAFSPDSKRIVTTSDKSVTIWSASTGARLVRWRASVRTAAFSSDGRHVLTTGSGGNARVWNAATGRQFRVLHVAQHNDYVRANMAFSPDATLVAGHTEHGVAVWDVATGRRRAVLRGTLGELGGAPAFSADDRYVYADTDDGAVGSGGVTRAGVWDAATGARIAAFRAGPALGDGVFSNDGRLVLTRGADAVEVWNARTGEPLAIMRGHGKANVDSVESASFSPDGRFVITSGTDGTAKIWDPETGERVGTLRAATQTSQTSAPAARFSPDGRRIVFVSGTFALLYECEECGTLAELRRLAEARISRTITDREHKRYLRATVGG
jgi:WD40 repeat protein